MKFDTTYGLPLFETERLLLRPIKDSDALSIFQYASDEEVTKYNLFDVHRSIDDTIKFIELMKTKYKQKNTLDYAIILKETNETIGTGGFFDLDKVPVSVEIGYIISKTYWGKGIVKEAMEVLIKYVFEVLDVHRVEGYHFAENVNSGKVQRKLGMTYEGEQKDKLLVRGEYRTLKLYGLINPKHQINAL